MSTRKSLRVIEGGLASPDVAVAAIVGLPLAGSERVAGTSDDPIFAAIEAHKLAFRRRLRASRSLAECSYDHPDRKSLGAADSEARDIDSAAAVALTANPPTTIAAALA